jgi:outer membrane protein assembly factor BamB
MYSGDHVLFCTRHQDTIGIVDWRSKRLVWTWGQGVLSGPHDATLLSNGNILVFDNGLSRGWSRVLEVNPERNEIVWEYHARAKKDFFTASRGSNQRLPNGNTLVAESDKGRAFEVTPDGKIVWEFLNPFRNSKGDRATIVRFYRLDAAAVAVIEQKRGEGRRKADLSSTGSRNSSQDSY